MAQSLSAKTMERLTSGLHVIRAADDVASLQISDKLQAQIIGFAQAAHDAQDGVSLIQTAEGALEEVTHMLQRMRELSVLGATDTLTSTDRGALSSEIVELAEQITAIANQTTFNSTVLLDGGLGTGGTPLVLHVGTNEGNDVVLTIEAADARSLDVNAPPAGPDNATIWTTFIGTVEGAIEDVATQASVLGAVEKQLNHLLSNLSVAWENSRAADSRFRHAHLSMEVTTLSKALALTGLDITHGSLESRTALEMHESLPTMPASLN